MFAFWSCCCRTWPGVVVENAEVTGARLCIWARARADSAACPRCGRSSARVHSRYQRRLADAAAGGRRVVIRLQVRRLFCDGPGCKKQTFAEQVPGLTTRYARKTVLLAGGWQHIAAALAGRAGARLTRALPVAASRSTLLRLVMTRFTGRAGSGNVIVLSPGKANIVCWGLS